MIDEKSRYIFPEVKLPKNTELLEAKLNAMLKKSIQTAWACQVMLVSLHYIDYTPTLTKKLKDILSMLKLEE